MYYIQKFEEHYFRRGTDREMLLQLNVRVNHLRILLR